MSLVNWPFLSSLGVLATVAVLVEVFVKRLWLRMLCAVVSVGLVVLCTLAAVNAQYHYYPTFNSLIGKGVSDRVTPRQIQKRITQAKDTATEVVPAKGAVEPVTIPGTKSRFKARRAQIYFPPIWFTKNAPTLPVLVLLHGVPGTPTDWPRGALADNTADDFAKVHGRYAPIMVFPDSNGSISKDTECLDGANGNAETYLVDDVFDFVVRSYNVYKDASHWAIGGLSEGGYCALSLGLRHPDRFATILDFSGPDQPTYAAGIRKLASKAVLDAHDPRLLLQETWSGPPIMAWFEDAAHTTTNVSVHDAARMASAADIPTCYLALKKEKHDFVLWHQALVDAYPWILGRLGIGSPVSCVSFSG